MVALWHTLPAIVPPHSEGRCSRVSVWLCAWVLRCVGTAPGCIGGNVHTVRGVGALAPLLLRTPPRSTRKSLIAIMRALN